MHTQTDTQTHTHTFTYTQTQTHVQMFDQLTMVTIGIANFDALVSSTLPEELALMLALLHSRLDDLLLQHNCYLVDNGEGRILVVAGKRHSLARTAACPPQRRAAAAQLVHGGQWVGPHCSLYVIYFAAGLSREEPQQRMNIYDMIKYAPFFIRNLLCCRSVS